jgi:ubiquinone/menaquinone biosynthesis C-methylase UbiE
MGPMEFILDIGGEGTHPHAWNLNPSRVRTLNPRRGAPIPRHISGRADAIPLPDHSVDQIIVERTPLRKAALHEIVRVLHRPGSIVLRHAMSTDLDPHRFARTILPGLVRQRSIWVGRQMVLESCFRLGHLPNR